MLNAHREGVLSLMARMQGTMRFLPPQWARQQLNLLIRLRRDSLYVFDEMEAIAAQLNRPLVDVLAVQLAYELMLSCTAVVMPQGEHHRTLDWPVPEMKTLMVQLDVVRNGQLLCRALTLPGYCGFLQGMVPHGWSGAINHRTHSNTVLGTARRYLGGRHWPVSFALRRALLTCKTYTEARGMLRSVALVSPCYFTLCGLPGQGCGLVRASDTVVEERSVDEGAAVVLANHDKEELDATPNPDEDDGLMDSIGREEAAYEAAAACRGRNCTELRRALQEAPIYSHETVMNCIMVPATDVFQWRVRGQRRL